jgi:hypothetical protein
MRKKKSTKSILYTPSDLNGAPCNYSERSCNLPRVVGGATAFMTKHYRSEDDIDFFRGALKLVEGSRLLLKVKPDLFITTLEERIGQVWDYKVSFKLALRLLVKICAMGSIWQRRICETFASVWQIDELNPTRFEINETARKLVKFIEE